MLPFYNTEFCRVKNIMVRTMHACDVKVQSLIVKTDNVIFEKCVYWHVLLHDASGNTAGRASSTLQRVILDFQTFGSIPGW